MEKSELKNLKLDIKKLKKISAIREKIEIMIHENIPICLIEYMLEPIENILEENGVNLKETNY